MPNSNAVDEYEETINYQFFNNMINAGHIN